MEPFNPELHPGVKYIRVERNYSVGGVQICNFTGKGKWSPEVANDLSKV